MAYKKENYIEFLDSLSNDKKSVEYRNLKKLIEQYYEFKQLQNEMFEHMRNKCQIIERKTNKVKTTALMRWFLGPNYVSKSR